MPPAITITGLTKQLSSRAELLEWLQDSEVPYHLLGRGCEAPREFFLIQFTDTNPIANIAVLSAGVGTKPQWQIKGDRLFVGFNDRVGVFAGSKLKFESDIPLLSLFWEFVDLPQHPHTCIVCETGVVGMLPDGLLIWRVDTDLIKEYEVVGTQIQLQFSDSPSISVDLTSGRRRG